MTRIPGYALILLILFSSVSALGTDPGAGSGEVECRLLCEGAGFLGDPTDVEWRQGTAYILDAEEKCVWLVGEDGKHRKASLKHKGCGLKSPWDLFMDSAGRLYVTDVGTKTIHSYDFRNKKWGCVKLDHNPIYGAAVGNSIFFNGGKSDGGLAVIELTGDEGTRHGLGQRIDVGDGPASLDYNVNSITLAVDDQHVVVGYISIARVRVYRRTGELVSDFTLTGDMIDRVRKYYLEDSCEQEPITSALLVDDMRKRAQPGQFNYPVYIADMVLRGDSLFVLAGNVISEYRLDGTKATTYPISGKFDGERVIVHEFAAAGNDFIGLDAHHYKKLYRIRIKK